ncbi:MAG: hypothetical protein IKO93_19410, partial [Lentisphaeria bacterium]|nr:hypothetical protein [Lentisphaeria bacterium]
MKISKWTPVVAGLISGLTASAAPAEDELDHECTSWIIFSDLTKNNTNILHKNRDAAPHDVRIMLSEKDSPRRWIGLGNNVSPCMGMNSSALAAVMNSGEICADPPEAPGKKPTPAILQAILESCDTAAEAVKKLQEFHREGDYSHGKKGSIFFFTDPKEGYICEMTGKFCSVQRYDSSYAFRANIWHNPGMAQFSRNGVKRFLDSCGRESVVLDSFGSALDKNGKLTLADVLELSRQDKQLEGSPLERSVCFKRTNSASTQVIHREFPQTLSTIWVLIGHPRHTIYLPIPICAEKLLPSMLTPEWAAASWKRFNKLGLHARIPAEWTALEKQSIAEYEKAVSEAEKLL